MNIVVAELRSAWESVRPPRGDRHGPLAPMLVALTVVTGLVDAFSYLELGRVFVANMTGNAVFLAFDLGGAPGFLWWALLLAIAAFVVGALAGGRLAHGTDHRGRHLLAAAAVQFILVTAAFVVALVVAEPYSHGSMAVLVILLGLAMGLQNATARALAVPDLTTTVLTLTVTGIAADSSMAGGPRSKIGRRGLSILSMFFGGLIGAVLVVHDHGPWALFVAVILLAGVIAGAALTRGSVEPWTVKP